MTAKPSLDLVRSATDTLVLHALMDHRRLTRAEVASQVGISKPTASQSVRRLVEAGLLTDTGERTTGRGRVGSYYALADDIGTALVVSITPAGVVAETVTAHGDVAARTERAVDRPATPAQVTQALQAAARTARRPGLGPTRLAVVSASQPVDRRTGRLVGLPDAPFLRGDLSPADALSGQVDGPVLVDNDVNWAARAERDAATDTTIAGGGGPALDDFAYLYLGEGLGCALVSDGQVRRGHAGIAGEIAHLVTAGPDGLALPLIEVFAALDLRRPGTTAIDPDAVIRAVEGVANAAEQVRRALVRAVGGVLSAIIWLADPQLVILGGPWGSHPALIDAIAAELATAPRRVSIRPAAADAEPSLTAARTHARHALQNGGHSEAIERHPRYEQALRSTGDPSSLSEFIAGPASANATPGCRLSGARRAAPRRTRRLDR